MVSIGSTFNVENNKADDFVYISQSQAANELCSEIALFDPVLNVSEQKENLFKHDSKTDNSLCNESIVLTENCEDSNENFVVCKIDEFSFIPESKGSLQKVNVSAPENIVLSSDMSNFENDLEGFRCHICSYLLPSSRTLRHHLVKSHNIRNSLSFFCPLCDHECWSEKQLSYHMHLHHEVKRTDLACNVCGMQLSSKSELKAHLRKHVLHHSCPECPQKFGAKHQLALHAQDHIARLKPYICSLCGRRFKHTKAFFLHDWRHEKQNCPEIGCHEKFEDESYLLVHLRKVHKIAELQHENFVYLKDQLDRDIDELFCQFHKRHCHENMAAKLFPQKNNPLLKFIYETDESVFKDEDKWKEFKMRLQKNFLSFNNVLEIKNVLEQLISNSALKDENKGLKEEQNLVKLENILYKNNLSHLCGLCNHNFNSMEHLNVHMTQHKKNYHCHICSHSFKSIKLLRKHCCLHKYQENTSNNLGGSNVVKCPECGKLFSHQKSLAMHSRISHKHLCKFRCKTCKKSFSTKGHLNQHTLHFHKPSDGKRIQCTICDKILSSEKNLIIHLQLHGEGNSGDPATVFSCPKCKKKFVRKMLLHRHILQHSSEHKCTICGKVFCSACKLASHLSLHDKELKRRFPCGVCELKFSYKSQLRVHSLTHSGEKPFVCEICGKRFKRLQQCKVHSNLVHAKTRVQCKECLKHFGTTSNLIRHQIAFHINLKRWICGICSNSYAHSQDLRLHLKKIHQYALNNIDYKSKKSLEEIYVIPALNSYDIEEDVKTKVEQVYKEEIEKLREMYYKDTKHQSESDKVCRNKSKKSLVSILNPVPKKIETESKIISHPIETTLSSFGECAYCKSRTDDNTSGLWMFCDVCNALVCSPAHLNGHKSEAHNGYQCLSCNMRFLTIDSCVNHIEKSHSHIQAPYQMIDPQQWGHSLISHQVRSNVPFLTSVPQMRPLHVLPPQNFSLQLVSIPVSDYGSMLSLTGLQENAVFIQNDINKTMYQSVPLHSLVVSGEQPNYEPIHVATVNQDKLIPQPFRGNTLFSITPNNATSFPMVDPLSVNVVKSSETFTPAPATTLLYHLPETPNEDQRQPPNGLTTMFEGKETSLHLVQPKFYLETINSEFSPHNAIGSKSTGGACQQNETHLPPDDLTNLCTFQSDNTKNNSSAIDVFVDLTNLTQDGKDTEFLIPQANEPSEIDRLNPPPRLSLVKTAVKTEPSNSEATAPLLPPSNEGVVTAIPLTRSNYYELQESKNLNATQTVCEDTTNTLPGGVSKFTSHQAVEENGGIKYNSSSKLDSKYNEEAASSSSDSSSSALLTCRTCNKFFCTTLQLKRHKRTHDLKMFQCQVCKKSFVEKFNLKTHLMIHTKEKPRQCEKCGKKFRYFRDLKDHLHSHEGLLPFSCTSCDLKFLRGRDLTRHVKEQHSKLKFKCQECGREFKRKFYLEKIHLKTHRTKFSNVNTSNDDHGAYVSSPKLISTSEKTNGSVLQDLQSLKCCVCEERFSRKRALTSHLKTHKK